MITDLNARDQERADDKTRRRLSRRQYTGIHFNPDEQLFHAWQGGLVFDYGHHDAREMITMLERDGKARQLEQVLTLPIRGAEWEILPEEGDRGEASEVQEVFGETLSKIIGQALNATVFKKAFFELKWGLDGSRLTIDEVAWRPPQTCEAAWSERTGEPMGFRQRIALTRVPGVMPRNYRSIHKEDRKAGQLGYAYIPPQHAFIHTHGKQRDPVHGISDLGPAFWAYETRQKILFLWFQFLETQSLPKVIAYGDTLAEAEELAYQLADVGASGTVAASRGGDDPSAKMFEVVESSGQGAGQFLEAVRYLEQQMTASVLAGFQDLSAAASNGAGSYALSADQSEFFLKSRQAVADEVSDSIRRSLFKPLLQLNRGTDARIPKLRIGPLSRHDTQRALDVLKSVITAESLNVPKDFVSQLVTTTSGYLGLDEEVIERAVSSQQWVADERKATAAAQQQETTQAGAMASLTAQREQAKEDRKSERAKRRQTALKALSTPSSPLSYDLSNVSGRTAVDTMYELVQRVREGEDPTDAARDLIGAA